MDAPAPNYHREFLGSPHHAALGLFTLGVGFLSATGLGLIIGATAYAVGWIYGPDLPFFKHWVDRRRESASRVDELARLAEFTRRREAMLACLSPDRRARYLALARVCRDIEAASRDNPLAAAAEPGNDPRLRKLDELMWTFLRLLSIEQSLSQFLNTEHEEDIPNVLKEAEAEIARLGTEMDALKAKGDTAGVEAKQRFLGSRLDRLEVLRKRQKRIEQAEQNLALVMSEQDRLDQQIKLLRADAVATKNADALTARIDATVEHLDQTNKWLSELDEFKDLMSDIPETQQRIGYEAPLPPVPASGATPPPIIKGVPFAKRTNSRQQQSQ